MPNSARDGIKKKIDAFIPSPKDAEEYYLLWVTGFVVFAPVLACIVRFGFR